MRQLESNIMSKTILLTYDFPPRTGGIARYLHEIARNFPQGELEVIGLPYKQHAIFDNTQKFATSRLHLPQRWDPFEKQLKYLAPLFFKKLLANPKNHFTICGQAHYSLLLAAWLQRKLKKTPYGVVLYGLEILGAQQRKFPQFYNYLLKNADLIISISDRTAQIARDIGVSHEKIVIIQPPVEVEKLGFDISITEIKERYKLCEKKIILTVGRLVERKGHDVMLKAMPQIIEHIPTAHYLIIGSGPQESHLRNLANQLNIEKHVTFTGYIPDNELASYYQASSVFAMISRDIPETGDMEGFGIVYLEANLLGLPVIAGRSGGVTDAVIDNKTGLLVTPEDPNEVAHATVRLLNDTELSNRLAEGGKLRAQQEFNGAIACQKLIARITDITTNSG